MNKLQTVHIPSAATKAATNGTALKQDIGYAVDVQIVGTAPILFHRYDEAAVERTARTPKNSRTRKVDDLESFVYRTPDGEIGIPGRNFKACLREAGRSVPDPRSPRKSARDLVQGALQIGPFVASLGKSDWDTVDVQRVVVQRAAISRARPMFREGWTVNFEVAVLAPEYVDVDCCTT